MQVNIETTFGITTARLIGDIDAKSAPDAQGHIIPLAGDDCKIILDMSEVGYMSSAGLRMLLAVRRSIPASGRIVLTGLSEALSETMSVTGFLDFFVICETYDESVDALNS
jgi:anti-sigma B factor antagonist